jgi:serine/threonine-protein kinase
MIGQVLNGNYRLTDLLGSGGYADVYLARDLRTNAVVAVKILHPHVAQDPDVAARFEREATLARRLQTPHVARILDASQAPTSPPFMVMELVQGLTVAELVRRHGPFPVDEAVNIADQLLSALGSAHALGIIHRDVKPQNVMIDAERRVKVLDFGVARVVGAGSLSSSGHLLGTPEYMAPEQVDGRPIDHRADLCAAGAVLYQLLSGRAPYVRSSDTDVWELIRRVKTEQPPPIRQLRPEVPPALAAVVARAMEKDPARRFQSAYEMRQALASAMGADPPTPRPLPATAQMPAVSTQAPGVTQILPVPGATGASRASTSRSLRPPQAVGQRAGTGRAGLPAWQIAGLVAGAILLVLLGIVVGRMVPLPGAAPTPAATSVAEAPTAISATPSTSTATSSPAPTAAAAAAGQNQLQPASSTASPSAGAAASPAASPTIVAAVSPTSPPPSPTVPPKPTAPPKPPGVLLTDNFENPEIGQLPRVSPRPNDYVFAYDQGEYVINKINAALPAAPIVFVPGEYDNTVLAVDVRIVGDVASRYAFVVCRDQSNGGAAKQYRASIVPDGRRLILSRWDDGNQRVLAEARDDEAIQPGNAVNHLELRCAGTKIAASVNGTLVASADDLTLSRGLQGLGAGTFQGFDGTLDARFDNLEVRQP